MRAMHAVDVNIPCKSAKSLAVIKLLLSNPISADAHTSNTTTDKDCLNPNVVTNN